MKKLILILVVLILSVYFIGCVSSAVRQGGYHGLYPGVREGIDHIEDPWPSMPLGLYFGSSFLRTFFLIDLPFSFAMDTFLLPSDALYGLNSPAKPKMKLGNANITKKSDNNKVDEEKINNSLKGK